MTMASRPHLAVDVRMADDAGIGTYIRNVVPGIVAARPDWKFTLLGRRQAMDDHGWGRLPNAELRDCTTRIYTIAEQAELVARTPRRVDLFWSPHYNIPLLHRGRLLVTVHDVFHLAMPQYAPRLAQRAYARGMFAALGRRADAVICVSDFTRHELRKHVHVRAEPAVIHLGVDPLWHAQRTGEAPRPRPYIVFVGSVKPHKNLVALIRAFDRMKADVPHDLVIVGRMEGMRTIDDAAQAAAAAVGDRVVLAGELPIGELRRLVAWADLLVAPSLYEGFGLPPLEAMAAGCPVLVSRAASLPEVCGEAALYCNPLDEGDIAGRMRQVLLDEALRADLRARGRRHAAGFTWERCRERTAAVIEATLDC
jgi:glycosyltransferase involved in cell wall biosynthesis